MATQILAFPQRNNPINPLPQTLLETAPAPTPAASSFTLAPAIPTRFRGLHLVTADTPYSAAPTGNPSRDTQARANRIVAQVEHEVAQEAARQRTLHLNITQQPAAILPSDRASITSIETPAKVARRLFHALLAFALPA